MPRRLVLNLATTTSALLLLGSLYLDWASRSHASTLELRRGPRRVGFCSDAGRVAVGYARLDGPANPAVPDAQWLWPSLAPPARAGPPGPWATLGFGAGDASLGIPLPVLSSLPNVGSLFITTAARGRYVQAPWWLLYCAAAALPAARLAAASRRRRRRVRGLCPSCAYDLRATPGRCPECGSVSVAMPRSS